MRHVLDVERSILGQPWRWRTLADDQREGFRPDDLVTQLLLSRGATREALEAYRAPSIREFMPDPSGFRDMDAAAARLAQDRAFDIEHVAHRCSPSPAAAA